MARRNGAAMIGLVSMAVAAREDGRRERSTVRERTRAGMWKFRPGDPRIRSAALEVGADLALDGATREEAEWLAPRMSAEWIDQNVRARTFRSYLPLFGFLASALAVLVGLVGLNAVPDGERWVRFLPAALLLAASCAGVPLVVRAEREAWRPGRDALLQRFGALALAKYAEEVTRRGPRPKPRSGGVTHEEAEALARDWMRHLGVLDAENTRYVADGGIDVSSRHYVAQVKNYAGSVTVESVRALAGVAAAEGKLALYFTSGRISRDGVAFADRVNMALFHYDAVAGTIRGLNPLGALAVRDSIPEAFGLELA